MKINLIPPKTFCFLTLVFLFFNATLNATSITWLGGTGAWDDATMWDTGTVPSFGDDVIIPSGTVRIYNGDNCHARTIDVQTGAYLYVYNGGFLGIADAVNEVGLTNNGRVYIWGRVIVEETSSPDNNHSGTGILNDSYFYIFSSGELELINIDEKGINNTSSSYFVNYGELLIEGVDGTSISNSDRFYNLGFIDIYASTTYPDYGILNFDYFRNYAGGEIYINGGGAAGFGNNNNNTGAQLRNYGSIEVEYSSQNGISNNGGTITNYDGGLIINRYSGTNGFYNSSTGTITNNGAMQTYYSTGHNLYNGGTFTNNKQLNLLYSFSTNLYVPAGATFDNHKSVSTIRNNNSGSPVDVNVEGDLTNHDEGYFSIGGMLSVSNGTELINNGFFISYHDDGVHFIQSGSDFTNNAVIHDVYDAFPSGTNNLQVRVRPLTGPMQEGVPFPDALDVASLSGVTINGWYTDKTTTTSAGTYDENTNEFTPNSNAVGLTTLYVQIEINSSGKSRNCSIDISGGITPLTENDIPQFFESPSMESNLSNEVNAELDIFPNPTKGTLNITSELLLAPCTITLHNSLGQMIMSRKIEIGSKTARLELNEQMIDGVYYLKVNNEKQESTEVIYIQR